MNIASAGFSRFWQAGLQLLVTPVIVHLLGPKAYGLVGFYASLTLFLAFLDQALSPTLARELARHADGTGQVESLRRLLRTLEVLSCGLALILGCLIVGAAQWIARHWLAHSGFSETALVPAIQLMGLSLACQWPTALYASGFIGLGKQQNLVPIRVIITTVQMLGAALLLSTVAASPALYFAWMAATSAILSFCLRFFLWRIMPASQKGAGFDISVLNPVWRFAIGNAAIGLTTAILTQSSGLIIAKFCSLDQLAAYTLAMSLAAQVSTILVQPVATTLMPHFAALVTKHNEAALAREYHRWSRIFTALILPITGTLIVFGRPLLQLWLGARSPLVAPVEFLLPWIAVGTLLNTIMMPPYFLQIASGWTSLCVSKNVIAVFILLPGLLLALPEFGPIAAAIGWIALNLGYYLLEVYFMHHRLLRGELWTFWGLDTMLPILVVGTFYVLFAMIIPMGIAPLASLGYATAAAISAWILLGIVSPGLRADAFAVVRISSARIRSAVLLWKGHA